MLLLLLLCENKYGFDPHRPPTTGPEAVISFMLDCKYQIRKYEEGIFLSQLYCRKIEKCSMSNINGDNVPEIQFFALCNMQCIYLWL